MKKITAILLAVLFAAAAALSVFFICRAAEKNRIKKSFETTVSSVKVDAVEIINSASAEYEEHLKADVNSLITLCGVDGRDAFGTELAHDLLMCYAYLLSHPEACRDNMIILYNTADAYLSDGDAAAFREGVVRFNKAAETHTAEK